MLWIIAIATLVIAAAVIRHAVQDHRDAEIQRRDALADIERNGAWTAAATATSGGGGEVEMTREVEREVRGVTMPAGMRRPAKPQSDDRAHTR